MGYFQEKTGLSRSEWELLNHKAWKRWLIEANISKEEEEQILDKESSEDLKRFHSYFKI